MRQAIESGKIPFLEQHLFSLSDRMEARPFGGITKLLEKHMKKREKNVKKNDFCDRFSCRFSSLSMPFLPFYALKRHEIAWKAARGGALGGVRRVHHPAAACQHLLRQPSTATATGAAAQADLRPIRGDLGPGALDFEAKTI